MRCDMLFPESRPLRLLNLLIFMDFAVVSGGFVFWVRDVEQGSKGTEMGARRGGRNLEIRFERSVVDITASHLLQKVCSLWQGSVHTTRLAKFLQISPHFVRETGVVITGAGCHPRAEGAH